MVAPVSRAFLALRTRQAVHCGLLTRIHEGMRIYPRVLCSVRCPCRTQAQLVSWILVDVRLLHVLAYRSRVLNELARRQVKSVDAFPGSWD
jgi:hypothetical protein